MALPVWVMRAFRVKKIASRIGPKPAIVYDRANRFAHRGHRTNDPDGQVRARLMDDLFQALTLDFVGNLPERTRYQFSRSVSRCCFVHSRKARKSWPDAPLRQSMMHRQSEYGLKSRVSALKVRRIVTVPKQDNRNSVDEGDCGISF